LTFIKSGAGEALCGVRNGTARELMSHLTAHDLTEIDALFDAALFDAALDYFKLA